MLLYLIPHLTSHITVIINKCLASGKFPTLWKNANIIPTPKVFNPTDLTHFRPISILPTMSKVLKMIVADQFGNYIAANNILPIAQSGFRCNHSTSTALLKVTDDLLNACDDHKNTCPILLDYSKAFDALDHS